MTNWHNKKSKNNSSRNIILNIYNRTCLNMKSNSQYIFDEMISFIFFFLTFAVIKLFDGVFILYYVPIMSYNIFVFYVRVTDFMKISDYRKKKHHFQLSTVETNEVSI